MVRCALSRTPWLGRGFRIGHLGVVGHFGRRRIHRFRGAVGQFVGRSLGLGGHLFAFGRIGSLAVLAGLVLLVAVLALFAFVFVGLVRTILAHIEAVEQIMHDVAEAALIGEHALEPIEIASGALLDQGPPQLDKFARHRRRRLTGKPLAHQHRKRVLKRSIGAIGDFVEFATVKTVVEHGGEIFGDTAHAAGPDCLNASLFDRFEHSAGLLAARRQLTMHRRVMAGEPQGDSVGMTTNDCSLALIKLAAAAPAGGLCRRQGRAVPRQS